MADMLELGRRAVACPSWRWMPGMRLVRPDGRFELRLNDESAISCPYCSDAAGWMGTGLLPDFSDPATRGCLLELVREKHGDPYIYVDCIVDDDGTVSWCAMGTSFSIGESAHPTEAEALVAALEAAPG